MTATSSQRLRIALLGCGLMGLPMARRLLAAGHELHIWNRTRSKAEPLAVEGAHVHDSPRLACLHADYVISMLENGKIETTVTRAKEVRSMAEKMVNTATIP